ncbi:MAG TPA: hypothetical protein VGD41_04080 [Pyrinomonadaceae bacterium]
MSEPKTSNESVVGTGETYRKWAEGDGIPLVENFFVEDIATLV